MNIAGYLPGFDGHKSEQNPCGTLPSMSMTVRQVSTLFVPYVLWTSGRSARAGIVVDSSRDVLKTPRAEMTVMNDPRLSRSDLRSI